MLRNSLFLALVACAVASAEDAKPKLRWSVKLDGVNEGCAAVADGQIFAPVVNDRAVVSLEAATGKVRWKTALVDTSPFPPVIDKDSVYVITGSCTLYRLARADGKILWSRWLAGAIESMPTLSDGKIYAASLETADHRARAGGWNLVCLDAATGKELLATPIGTDVVGAPLVREGLVYVTTRSGEVRAFDFNKRRILWKCDKAGARSMPVPCRDWLVTRTDDGLCAVNVKDGSAAWKWDGLKNDSRARAGHEFRVPMISGDLMYAVVSPTEVACIDLKDRKTVWTWSTGEATPGEPVMVGGHVYFGTSKGVVYSLDAHSGRKDWEVPSSAAIADAPSVMDGSLYFHNRSGGMVSIDAATPSATGWGNWGGSSTHSGPTKTGPAVVVTPSAADAAK